MHILLKAKTTRDIVGSASVDHLLYLGYIVIDYFGKMAQTAYENWHYVHVNLFMSI